MVRTQTVRASVVLLALSAVVAPAATAGVAETVSPGEADRFAPVPGSCPTFSWAADPGARGHELVVYAVQADGAGTLASSPTLTVRFPGQASSWTPSAERCLAPGRYAWAVRSRGVEDEAPWSEALLFEVSEVPSEAELKTALDVVRRYLDARGETLAGAVTPQDAGDARNVAPRGGRPSGAAADSNARDIGERIASRGVPGEPALVLGGTPVARLTASDFSRDSASAQAFDFTNPSGTMTLRVDGIDVVTTATDQDTTYLAGNQLQLSGTTFSVLEGSGSGLDADTLDGLDSSAFLVAGADDWVNETGDTMTGALTIDVAAGTALSTAAGDDIDLGGSLRLGGTLFLHGNGTNNTALGADALAVNTGVGNTALGASALQANTTGERSVAVGYDALGANTTGTRNVAVGYGALQANDAGSRNTAVGHVSLLSNTTGVRNVAVGALALVENTTGNRNIAVGVSALYATTIGSRNSAVGESSLAYNVNGNANAAVGHYALLYNTSGSNNVAVGQRSSFANTVGVGNVAVGGEALQTNTVGSNNVAIGSGAGYATTGSDNVAVSHPGASGESGVIRIGRSPVHTQAFIAGIRGVTPGGGSAIPVLIDVNGQLGTGGGSGLDADTLDGIDSTGFMPAGTDLWVDTAGDTMSGTLSMGGNAISAVGGLELDDAATVTKSGARFVWDDGALGSLALGRAALDSNTSGAANTGLGHSALQTNTSGANNTAVGWNAMRDNTDGSDNTAVGKLALVAGASNTHNTAMGSGALSQNDTGDNNTGVGSNALQANTSGYDNTAVGRYAGALNTEGRFNSALGSLALSQNTLGFYNTAVGGRALLANTTGNENTAVGEEALVNSSTGLSNVAIGQAAMLSNTSGNDNTAIGHRALYSSTTGSGNVAVGRGAGTSVTGDLNVSIANDGLAGESGVIRIGTFGNQTAAFLAGVYGVTPSGGTVKSVVVDENGQLGSIAFGGGSGLDADTLDGIDSTGFLAAGTDLWVDVTGDVMSGSLNLGYNALVDVGGVALDNGAEVTKGGARFVWDNGDSFGAGRAALANTTGSRNTGVGTDALTANTGGANNTAVGYRALAASSTGNSNTAVGRDALRSNTASHNTAVGGNALYATTDGESNTAVGSDALLLNTSGKENAALGRNALGANTFGNYNTAVGTWSLGSNQGGARNTAVGIRALGENESGGFNTAVGRYALRENVAGNYNTAVGSDALGGSTTGARNTAVGHRALNPATEGNNSALGARALGQTTTGYENTAVGADAMYMNSTGRRNIALGYRAGYATNGDDNIIIGHGGYGGGESGRIRIGTTGTHVGAFVAGIHSVTPAGPTPLPVVVDAYGQLGTTIGGGGSGIDADLLDGIDSTAFVLDTGDTITGNLAVGGGLDVTGASLTVGAANFTVDPGTGNTVVAGTLDVTGATAFDGQVDLRDVTNVGDSQSDTVNVVATFRLEPRSVAPACNSAADVGTVYYDADDGTFCFCEGSSVFDYRPLDGVGACS